MVLILLTFSPAGVLANTNRDVLKTHTCPHTIVGRHTGFPVVSIHGVFTYQSKVGSWNTG